jgi:hypothetical protein
MLFEIRNYHYDPSKFEAYTRWGKGEAKTFLEAHLDIVGIWFDIGEPPEFGGEDPTPSQHGAPNVTWIIRWESMEHRNQGHKELSENQEWQEIWSRHPDPNGYLHMQVTFAEQI